MLEIKIIGEGPIKEDLVKKVKDENIGNVKFTGHITGAPLYSEIRKSTGTVLFLQNGMKTVRLYAEELLDAEKYYENLIEIYRQAMNHAG